MNDPAFPKNDEHRGLSRVHETQMKPKYLQDKTPGSLWKWAAGISGERWNTALLISCPTNHELLHTHTLLTGMPNLNF